MLARTCIGALALLCCCTDPGDATTQAYVPGSSDTSSSSSTPAGDATTAAASTTGSNDVTDAPASSEGSDESESGASDESTTGAPLPEFDDVPWQTGDEIGYGIAYKDLGDPNAHHAFIGYAGYPFPLDASQSWVRELYLARLRELGVRYVWAVQGPATVSYSGLEVGNTSIAAKLTAQLDDQGKVIVAGHSSGSYVAHELLGQLEGDFDPTDVTADRVVYFDLDGGTAGLYDAGVQRLHRAYFVSVFDSATSTSAPNRDAMQYLDSTWHAKGGYLELEGNGSGCNAGAQWCLHMVVINALPHDPNDSDVIDYYDFVDRPVVTEWLDRVSADAGL
jgi:hypothetical protein